MDAHHSFKYDEDSFNLIRNVILNKMVSVNLQLTSLIDVVANLLWGVAIL